MTNTSALPPLAIPGKQQPPKLSLATPMGTHQTPQETAHGGRRKLPPLQMPGGVSAGGSSDNSANSRADSFGAQSNNLNGSISTTSSYSVLNFADVLRNPNDPESAAYSSSSAHSGIGMERENSMQGNAVDLEKHLVNLSLEKGGPLDAEDLDDLGWKAARKEGRIRELGSLGEGAGGAVTRCVLEGGKTVFALKVGCSIVDIFIACTNGIPDHHHRPEPGRQTTNCP